MLPDPNTPPIDHCHLAEKFALAERNDHRLAGAVDLGDVDPAVEHDEQFAPGRTFLENDFVDLKFVDAFFNGHGDPAPLAASVFETHATRELRPASILPRKHVSRERRRCKRPGGYGLS
jgi:hypothetical protein